MKTTMEEKNTCTEITEDMEKENLAEDNKGEMDTLAEHMAADAEGADRYTEEYKKLKNDPRVILMKNFRQHAVSTTYDHVCHVAEMSHVIQKGLHLQNIDEDAMLRGAMLHDYYQYDTHDKTVSAWRHGTSHAGHSLKNAEAAFDLNDKERDIIYSHMWPLNLTHLPHSREAWIVSCADKVCAVKEAVFHRTAMRQKRTPRTGKE